MTVLGTDGLPQINSDPNGSVTPTTESTFDATVREYDEDGLLESRNLPRANNADGRWRQEYDYLSRGFIQNVGTIFDWNDSGSNQSAYSQHYGSYDNGWLKSSSDAQLSDPSYSFRRTAPESSGTGGTRSEPAFITFISKPWRMDGSWKTRGRRSCRETRPQKSMAPRCSRPRISRP